jgi:outer membrane protein assembly factor BamB
VRRRAPGTWAKVWLPLLAALPVAAMPRWTHIADYTDTRQLAVGEGLVVGASSRGAWLHEPVSARWEHLSLPEGLAAVDLTGLCFDGEGTVFWAGADASLSALHLTDGAVSRGFFEFREHPQIQRVHSLSADGDLVLVAHDTGLSVFDYLPASDEFLVEWNLSVIGSFAARNPVLAAAVADDWLVVAAERGLAWGRGWPQAPGQFHDWRDPGGLEAISRARLASHAGQITALLEPPEGPARAFVFADGTWTTLWSDESLTEVTGFAAGPRRVIALRRTGGTRLLFDDGATLQLDRETGALAWQGDTLWVAVRPDRRPGGLLPVVGGVAGELRAPAVPGAEEFVDLDEDAGGRIWAVGVAEDRDRNGVYRLDGDGGWTPLRLGYAHFGSFPTSVHCDSERGVWLGGWGRGLSWVDPEGGPGDTLRFWTADSSAPGQGLAGFANRTAGSDANFVLVSDVEEDPAGNIWLVNHQALDDSCLVVIPAAWRGDRTTPFQRRHYAQNRERFPYWILPVAPGDVWAGVGGKDARDPNKRVLHLLSFGQPTQALDAWSLRERELASAVFNFGIAEAGSVTALALDADDQIWAGTDAGVYYGGLYGGSEQFSRVQFISGLLSESVSSVATDARGRVWLASAKGLNVFLPRELRFEEPEEAQVFNQLARNLGTLRIGKLLLDREGGLWLATNIGLFHCPSGAADYGPAPGGEVRCYPNPFRPEQDGLVRILSEDLANDAKVAIYDLDGRLLRRLSLSQIERGWDGRDAEGRLLESGVYLVLVHSGGGSAAGKLAIIR